MPSAKRAFSFLSSCFTNSYFEIKLVFTPVKEKCFFFYQPKWASSGQSQSQTSWRYLIKQTSYLIPPVPQRLCRWDRGIILEVLEFCWLLTFPHKCLKIFTKICESKENTDTRKSWAKAWHNFSATTKQIKHVDQGSTDHHHQCCFCPPHAVPTADITNGSDNPTEHRFLALESFSTQCSWHPIPIHDILASEMKPI